MYVAIFWLVTELWKQENVPQQLIHVLKPENNVDKVIAIVLVNHSASGTVQFTPAQESIVVRFQNFWCLALGR